MEQGGVLETGRGPDPCSSAPPPGLPDTASTSVALTQRLGSAESHQPRDNLPCRLEETQSGLPTHGAKIPAGH